MLFILHQHKENQESLKNIFQQNAIFLISFYQYHEYQN